MLAKAMLTLPIERTFIYSLWTVSGGNSDSSFSFEVFSLKLEPLALVGDCPVSSAE